MRWGCGRRQLRCEGASVFVGAAVRPGLAVCCNTCVHMLVAETSVCRGGLVNCLVLVSEGVSFCLPFFSSFLIFSMN